MLKLLFLTFDLEEFDLPIELCGSVIEKSEMYEITYDGAKKVIKLLDRCGIKSTFFTTTVFGRKYPNLLRELLKRGHEIAFHGYQHSHKYHKMKQKDAHALIRDGKTILEKITGKRIVGFRSPRLFSPSPMILKKIGFKYDSSTHPTWVPGHYFNMREQRSPSYNKGVLILPISVTPLVRAPFSWVWFRNFGLTYAKVCTKLCTLDQLFVNIYFHPWEFVDLSKYEAGPQLPLIIRRNTGGKMLRMVGSYIRWCRRNNFKITTIKKGLQELIFD